MADIDNEDLEDTFDLLIVANLTDDDKPEQVYADQVGLF